MEKPTDIYQQVKPNSHASKNLYRVLFILFYILFLQGCFRKLFTSIEDNYALIGGVGYATSVIVLTGSFLSCLLAQNVRKNRYDQML